MPNEHETLGSLFTDIADAIRAKTGGSASITADNFPSEIASIPSGGGLPDAYQQVDYIESSGTQYIDTGVIASNNTNIDCEIYVDQDTPTWYCAFGAFSSNKAFQLMLKTPETNNKFRYFVAGNDISMLESYNTRIRFTTGYSGAQWDILGGGHTYVSTGSGHVTDYSLGIFAGHESSGFNAGALMRCYYFKIYDSGILIRDYVPCIRDNDGKAGLYDLVNEVFYGNQGTGEFIVPSL